MEILGSFPTSAQGNRYIIVAVDYVGKRVDAVALPTTGAAPVAEFFILEVLLGHRAPKYLTKDKGKCFVAKLTTRVRAALEINHQTMTSDHPQANGKVECLNLNLSDMLSMHVSEDHRDCDTALSFLRFAYNTSSQETTRKSLVI